MWGNVARATRSLLLGAACALAAVTLPVLPDGAASASDQHLSKYCYGTELRRCSYLRATSYNGRTWVFAGGGFNDPAGGQDYRTTIVQVELQMYTSSGWAWKTRSRPWATSDTSLHDSSGGGLEVIGCHWYRSVTMFLWSGSSSGVREVTSYPRRICA
jgi:hypothetical protein